MAAIVHSLLLLAFAAASPQDAITEMAASLADSEALAFVRALSKSMPEREILVRDVQALEQEFEVSSSIELISEKQDDASVLLDLDWYLELKPRAGTGALVRRRQRMAIAMRLEGTAWKVTSLQPLSFFAPR